MALQQVVLYYESQGSIQAAIVRRGRLSVQKMVTAEDYNLSPNFLDLDLNFLVVKNVQTHRL